MPPSAATTGVPPSGSSRGNLAATGVENGMALDADQLAIGLHGETTVAGHHRALGGLDREPGITCARRKSSGFARSGRAPRRPVDREVGARGDEGQRILAEAADHVSNLTPVARKPVVLALATLSAIGVQATLQGRPARIGKRKVLSARVFPTFSI